MLRTHQAPQVRLHNKFQVFELYPTQITGEGTTNDYTINTRLVTVTFGRSGSSDSVMFTFFMDSIAQENDETFSLQLVPTGSTTLPSGNAIYFQDSLSIIIMDNDSKVSILC